MRLALREEIRSLEAELIRDGGFPSSALMETAGRRATAIVIRERLWGARRVRVACGRGNNGGDGFVMARHLREAGYDVRVQLVGQVEELTGEPAVFAKLFRWCGGVIEEMPHGGLGESRDDELQIDALLGTGLDRPIEGVYAVAVGALVAARRAGARIFAVDIPSGLDADKGRPLGEAVRAQVTCTFGLGKPGLYVTPGNEYAGVIEVVDIGLPGKSVEQWARTARLLDADESFLKLSPRPFAGHKGLFGHVLVAGGGAGKAGAAELACRGALRAGVGLVTLCSPRGAVTSMPEIMHEPVESYSADNWRDELAAKKTAVVFGPGTGASQGARDFLARLCGLGVPLVLDADGLNILAEEPGLLAGRRASTVLTPHPAEAARLLGLDTPSVQADRTGAALEIAQRYRSAVALKGARTVIAVPDGRYWINSSGSPALSAGGMGDVLAGAVGALLAGGMPAERAACVAVYVHGRAGEGAGSRAGGLLATELADRLPAELDRLVAP